MIASHEGVSCDPDALYGAGGLYDPRTSLERLREIHARFRRDIKVVEELYPASRPIRPPPAYLENPDGSDNAHIRATLAAIPNQFPVSAPALVVRLKRALIWNNMVFLLSGGQVVPLYENYRPCDQIQTGSQVDASSIDPGLFETIPGDRPVLYVGSAGSFNLGHWLADDFPRYRAFPSLLPRHPGLRLAYTGFSDTMNAIRREGLGIVLPEGAPAEAICLDLQKPWVAENLLYVTPVSYHPYVKSDGALAYMRELPDTLGWRDARPGRRLFVNRAAPWPRRLANEAEVRGTLDILGFEEVFTERMTLREQITAFGNAEAVVGIMGAAMGGVVFCPETTFCHHLVPDCWAEPFFWDLSSGRPDTYGSLFGRSFDEGQLLHNRDFEIAPEALVRRVVGKLRAGL